jgi:acyl-CoA dehydrogenase
MEFLWIGLLVFVFLTLVYHSASASVYAIGIGLVLASYLYLGQSLTLKIIFTVFYVLFTTISLLGGLRRKWITRFIFTMYKKLMPRMSDTEREALCAGDVGWTGQIFSGNPDWQKLNEMRFAAMSKDEIAFLNGPVEELCAMVDNWEISRSLDIPEEVWEFLKKHKFFSMIIPVAYGGLEFSAVAQSTVIAKLSSHCVALATVVCVPNSLGPGELLMHYGTEKQKNHFLPRLASGEDIPCFALTSPLAGSDAASITDNGVVCHAEFEGKDQLCIRLNWDKRYITLAPVATILGLAFKLYDPDHLLGSEEYVGITCALIPVATENVVIGRRHLPVGSSFPNGPTQGNDVIIPVSWIIGGAQMAGQGWKMLMACLAAGRGISLPSVVSGGASRYLLASTAYSRIRTQFNSPIGYFGGVQEALMQVVGYGYLCNALRLFTASHIDEGLSPVVASAITKYNATEYGRIGLRASLDLHGGKAICMGPKNYLAQPYFEMPVAITVEGANILTRTMITFGQGVIRCHPYVMDELFAAQEPNSAVGLRKFDKAFFGHVGFVLSNHLRSLFMGLTNAYLIRVPHYGPLKRYYQLATRFSTILALVADMAMASLGAELKRKECLSGRLADMVSSIYMVTSVLKYYDSHSEAATDEEEILIVKWVCLDLFKTFERQLHEFLLNLPNRWVGRYLRLFCLPLGRKMNESSDNLMQKISLSMLKPNKLRDRFKQYVAGCQNSDSAVSQMENVFEQSVIFAPLEKKLRNAFKQGLVVGKTYMEILDNAVAKGVLVDSEREQLIALYDAKMSIINVDDFSNEELVRH